MRRQWPIFAAFIGIGIALWLFTTTGGRQVFVEDMLGEAYDSQVEHFLHGDVDVDGDAIQHEAMIVNGKVRMYFGPFPALLRMPLNMVYPAGRGRWSRISVFCAAMISLGAFAGLIRDALAKSRCRDTARDGLSVICLTGFAFASPLLLFLGEASIYNEAVIWGLAGAVSALLFAFRSREREGASQMRNLLAFSISASAALLSRLTFGVPLLAVALLLIPRIRQPRRARKLLALLLPLTAAVAFHVLLSYARFGSVTGVNYDYYINPTHRDFARTHGMFSLRRVPPALGHYFSWRPPSLQAKAPFFRAERHAYGVEDALTSLPTSETYLSVTWCSGWLVVGALVGTLLLFSKGTANKFYRVTAAALMVECLAILAYFAIAQRYSADFYPFLIAAFVVFLSRGGLAFRPIRYVFIALVAISACVNTLTTISWLRDCDQNVTPQSRETWTRLFGN